MVWACQYPEHDGDRVVPFPPHRFTKRVTYYRQDGAERRHETTVMRLCRACVDLDAAKLKPSAEGDQVGLFL